MRIYIDDDTASAALANLLRNAGHDVCVPADAGMGGRDDAMHLHTLFRTTPMTTPRTRAFLT